MRVARALQWNGAKYVPAKPKCRQQEKEEALQASPYRKCHFLLKLGKFGQFFAASLSHVSLLEREGLCGYALHTHSQSTS